jgi:hypothetical protein
VSQSPALSTRGAEQHSGFQVLSFDEATEILRVIRQDVTKLSGPRRSATFSTMCELHGLNGVSQSQGKNSSMKCIRLIPTTDSRIDIRREERSPRRFRWNQTMAFFASGESSQQDLGFCSDGEHV